MDLLTAAEKRVQIVSTIRRWPPFAGLTLYILVVAATIAHHEPWADEAQSWLLARDATLVELWTRLLHYEGTTGLWQTLLHALIHAGLPYAGMSIVAGLLGVAASVIILWLAPFPLGLRIALPLGYFLCYQYAVIARSYDLLPVLVLGCAALFERAAERPRLFTLLLCLMAAVSVHGMILSVSMGVAAVAYSHHAYSHEWKRALPFAAIFAAVAATLIFVAWPAADGTFVTGLNFSFEHFIEVAGRAFAAAFTGELFSSLAIVALSIPLLWRGGGLLFFAVASTLLCGVYAIVYSQVWHFGVLFLAWIFALWIAWSAPAAKQPFFKSAAKQPLFESVAKQPFSEGAFPSQLAMAALAIAIAVQCFWTGLAVKYDWTESYSGSLAAAQELAKLPLTGRRIYAIGFACVAIQPYFPRSIFANWNDGRPHAYWGAYWDWSTKNHVNQDALHLGESQPDYVMIGYKNEVERGIWTGLVRNSGYQAIHHFQGNSFWHNQVFEPEGFDLYRRDNGR